MSKYISEQKWLAAIRHDDWYLRISDDYKSLIKQAEESSKEVSREIKDGISKFFEDHLAKNDVALGKDGPNWDEERKPIDTVVIHHTKNAPGITWQRLSAMQLVRLYATYYASSRYKEDTQIKGPTPLETARARSGSLSLTGQAIFSNHFRNGRQGFYAYHCLCRIGGPAEGVL